MTTNPPPGTAHPDSETVTRWIRDHAHPITTLDPDVPLADLEPLRDMVGDATVVALGASTRGAHELVALQHRMLRFLVEELGFRSLALEGDWATTVQFDEYVRTGSGDPRALLAGTRPFYRSADILAVVQWMRSYNEAHPTEEVRLVGPDAPDVQESAHEPNVPDDLDHIERRLAGNVIWWHEHTGHKIVYWGGIAHTAVGNPRTVSFPPSPTATGRNAGGYLRNHLGAGYVSVGMTFGHGSVPYDVPLPPPGFAELPLGSAGQDTYLLDLRADRPQPVREWLDSPTKTRLIGPHYDPEDDAAYHMAGGSFAGWFDVIAHSQQATPVRPLA